MNRIFSVCLCTVILASFGNAAVKNLNTLHDFQQFLKDSPRKPAIIAYTAGWCDPCRKTDEKFSKLSKMYQDRVRSATVDIDENYDTSAREMVEEVPSFVVYVNGKRVRSFTGANVAELDSMFRTYGL